jgi:hypothetical protein
MLKINDLQKKNAGFGQKKAKKGGFIRNLGSVILSGSFVAAIWS